MKRPIYAVLCAALVHLSACGDPERSTGGSCPSCSGSGQPSGSGSGGSGGGGTCEPETDKEFCERLDYTCGARHGSDNCGHERLVESCGSCTVDGMVPNPLISRGRPTSGSPDGTEAAVDGVDVGWAVQWSTPGDSGTAIDAHIDIDLGGGYDRILIGVLGTAGPYTAEHDGETHGGAPISAYTIEVSPSGADGSWTRVVDLPASAADGEKNIFSAREHVIDFEGMKHVRFSPLEYFSTDNWVHALSVAEIDIHDVSAGVADTWIFLGGKNYRGIFEREKIDESITPVFADFVHQSNGAYRPYVINGAEYFYTLSDEVDNLDGVLEVNPDVRYWGISFGSMEASAMSAQEFSGTLQDLIDKIEAEGHEPMLATIPFIGGTDAPDLTAYNDAIRKLTKDNGLHEGPDLYAYFQEHPTELCDVAEDQCETVDDWNFDRQGRESVNRLWAEAVSDLYGGG